MAAVRVHINGTTLRWARNLAKMSEDELGRVAGISAARITEFEGGLEKPTYVQTRKLAKKLDRPPAFLLAGPPEITDVPETVDFRGRNGAIPATLARELKRSEEHRRTLIDLEGEVAEPPLFHPVAWRTLEESAVVARRLLGIESGAVPPVAPGNPSLNYWRGLLEEAGLLVFQTTGIGLEAFRGLSVYHKSLPIILLNGADSAGGRIFTLFHELAHLANQTSGLCLLEEHVSDEALCNAFAAEFLMPSFEVEEVVRGATREDAVAQVARHFRVSKLAAAIKLTRLGRLTETELDLIRAESDLDWERNRVRLREASGVPPRWMLRLRDLGPTYVSSVFRALESDRISILDATYLLNAKVPTIEKMLVGFHHPDGLR